MAGRPNKVSESGCAFSDCGLAQSPASFRISRTRAGLSGLTALRVDALLDGSEELPHAERHIAEDAIPAATVCVLTSTPQPLRKTVGETLLLIDGPWAG
jgi:hypothetical protein